MKNKTLVIGPVTKDVIITQDDKYNQIGGAVYYQTNTLNQLNIPTTSIITIGKNDLELVDNFTNTNNVKKIITDNTMEYINIYDENNVRTQKAKWYNNLITLEKFKEFNINLNEYKTAIFSPLSPNDFSYELIKHIKEHNLETVLVIQGYLRKINKNNDIQKNKLKNPKKLLKYIDIISLDDNEMKIAFNLKEISTPKVHEIIEKYNLKTIIMTKGEDGSVIYTKDNSVEIPIIKSEKQVDFTGLGDTYIASYIAKKYDTDSNRIAAYFASIVSSHKLETKGPVKINRNIVEKELKKIIK
ncbi:MAG: hypothetical protein E7Z84_02260 [Methanosphaera stadtmanae]|nr:hypothetical protein [Methanosphaera stadtmanae]